MPLRKHPSSAPQNFSPQYLPLSCSQRCRPLNPDLAFHFPSAEIAGVCHQYPATFPPGKLKSYRMCLDFFPPVDTQTQGLLHVTAKQASPTRATPLQYKHTFVQANIFLAHGDSPVCTNTHILASSLHPCTSKSTVWHRKTVSPLRPST